MSRRAEATMLVVFDVNETVLDMGALDELFGGGERRTAWFELVIRLALVQTAIGRYRPFGEIALDCAAVAAPDLDPAALRDAMTRLPAHDDVVAGLTAVRDAGHRVVALGNSARETVETQLSHAGVRHLFDDVHSADDVRALKPAPAPYLAAVRSSGGSVEDSVLVAAHDWDVAGARAAGLRSVLLDRGLRPSLPGAAPDLVVSGLDQLAAGLASLPAGDPR